MHEFITVHIYIPYVLIQQHIVLVYLSHSQRQIISSVTAREALSYPELDTYLRLHNR